jgi:hypothetical protein
MEQPSKKNKLSTDRPSESLDATLDELSIFELDERLEFVAWCDTNCSCTTGTGVS